MVLELIFFPVGGSVITLDMYSSIQIRRVEKTVVRNYLARSLTLRIDE